MSTHARIGFEEEDGSIRSVYVHSDGYPRHTGYVLDAFYANGDRANALLDLGNLSFLGQHIESPPDDVDFQHRYDYTQVLVRNKGEHRDGAQVSKDRVEFARLASKGGEHFAYLWTPDGWLATRIGARSYYWNPEDAVWEPVATLVEKDRPV